MLANGNRTIEQIASVDWDPLRSKLIVEPVKL
jgi:hypothetical protein